MKLTSNLKAGLVMASALAAAGTVVGQAQYEVPHYDGSPYYVSSLEYGNEFTLSSSPTYTLKSVAFEYFSNYAQSGGLVVKMYDNDGAGGAPGTLEYTSAPLDIKLNGAQVNISFANVTIQPTMTLTVQFAGEGSGNAAGLVNPQVSPDVGTGPNGYWQNDAGGWALHTLNGASSYFTLGINKPITQAGVFTPEPGTYALAGLGGLVLLGASAYRRSRR
jgi:PEP-CTERM motif